MHFVFQPYIDRPYKPSHVLRSECKSERGIRYTPSKPMPAAIGHIQTAVLKTAPGF